MYVYIYIYIYIYLLHAEGGESPRGPAARASMKHYYCMIIMIIIIIIIVMFVSMYESYNLYLGTQAIHNSLLLPK